MKIQELKAKMRKPGLDAFVAIQNAHYLSGTDAATAVIVSKRSPIMICSRMEWDRATRESEIKDVRAYFPGRVPIRDGERVSFGKLDYVIARCLEELGVRRVGYDVMKPKILMGLRGELKAEYHEFRGLVWELRETKTRQEIGLLKKSAQIAELGMARAAELIKAGRSELELAAEAEFAMRKAGSECTPFNTIVTSGKNSWLPHGEATEKRLKRRELIVVDLGATYRGYASDMTRTFALDPTRAQRDLLDVAKRAQQVAMKRVQAGVKASKADEAARGVFRRAGCERYCLHGTGHGLGLNIHEPPSLSMGSDDVLREGMVVTVEPGVYVKNVGAARFEDMVVVTAGNCRPLTTMER